MNGRIAIGVGLTLLVWAGVTLFEGLWLGGAALVALGGAAVFWGVKQRGR